MYSAALNVCGDFSISPGLVILRFVSFVVGYDFAEGSDYFAYWYCVLTGVCLLQPRVGLCL